MLNKLTAKTASALRHPTVIVLLIALALGVGLSVYEYAGKPGVLKRQGTHLSLGTREYSLEVSDNDRERQQGLSGRKSMDQDKGMLFVFQQPDDACFWMKDMHLALDIVWLDVEKRVIHIERDVKPETYPLTFCPPKAATYVIELNAGEAEAVKAGQKLTF